MNKQSIKKESLEEWQFGPKIRGYFEPTTGETHILRGEDQERITLMHENVHMIRSDKLTAKFAALCSIKPLNRILLGLMVLFGIYGSITAPMAITGLVPFFFVSTLYLFLYGCLSFEEAIADHTVTVSIKELKQNRGENKK